jgi:predicted NBD/HSP70 family sugar kinase
MRRSWIGFLLAGVAAAGSETPPQGPPWLRDFAEAQELAERTGRPIFVYMTKTY